MADPLSNHELGRDELKVAAHIHSFGGVDLDLSRVDEAFDMGNYSMGSTRKIAPTLSQVKSSLVGTLNNELYITTPYK